MKRLRILLFILLVATYILETTADSKSLVAHTGDEKTGEKESLTEVSLAVPTIYHMSVKSVVRNRYANTTVISKVKNVANKAQEATFAVVLPETAFISGFVMEINGKNYTAYVKEKEEAKKIYDKAVAKGSTAAHVVASARDSNRFVVSVNNEPEAKAAFYLNYEELLKREDGHYELVINLHPGQPVKDLSAEVIIAESRKITSLKTPPIRSGNEIGNERSDLEPKVEWSIVNETSAVVMFHPNPQRQIQLAHLLGTKEEEGLAGQFVVQYDVERDPKGGEVLIQDGYFVHFFAPSNLAPIPKDVVFVLDTSSSMSGQKLQQLIEAMHKILEQLHAQDMFHLVEFNSDVKVWNLDDPAASSTWYKNNEEAVSFDGDHFPKGYLANTRNIKQAKAVVSSLEATKATNIYSALHIGLYLARLPQKLNDDSITRQPMLLFLTDGDPTVGITSTEKIINDVTKVFNSDPKKVPVFTLSFGDGADRRFLQKLSFRNAGFSRHIYEAADAALQLQNLYRQISSPLLANVTFKYEEPTIANVTDREFPLYFGGSELVVAGWCGKYEVNIKSPMVDAWNGQEYVALQPTVQQSGSSLERLWGYLTIKQVLEKRKALDDEREKEELKKKALDLALKYSFVTPVSSLVVVKPDVSDAIDAETANSNGRFYPDSPFLGSNDSNRVQCSNIVILVMMAIAKHLADNFVIRRHF